MKPLVTDELWERVRPLPPLPPPRTQAPGLPQGPDRDPLRAEDRHRCWASSWQAARHGKLLVAAGSGVCPGSLQPARGVLVHACRAAEGMLSLHQ
jgi:hypothetical protein